MTAVSILKVVSISQMLRSRRIILVVLMCFLRMLKLLLPKRTLMLRGLNSCSPISWGNIIFPWQCLIMHPRCLKMPPRVHYWQACPDSGQTVILGGKITGRVDLGLASLNIHCIVATGWSLYTCSLVPSSYTRWLSVFYLHACGRKLP